MIDATIVRADQHSAGAKKKEPEKNQALGPSKGGMSPKIQAMSDALGNPMGFYLTAGQLHDLQEADV
jgi:hypothetical protein